MSDYTNPTALTVGKSGKLCGLNYRVNGRVVLGASVDGETCYWSEFNLLDDSGKSATLVYEEGEAGPEWKLFFLFEPVVPMAAAEAASKKVGDTVNLSGNPVPVTLVGQSRVYHIEGRAPEGVEVGDIADYFNADTGSAMEVASWTGDEIEFYRGLDVPADEVASAFGLSPERPTNIGGLPLAETGTRQETKSGIVPKAILVASIALVGLVAFAGFSAAKKPGTAAKQQTPPARLAGNASGTLHGQLCVVTGHAVAGIARVGSRYDWHEYALSDGALLINNLTGDASQWHLLRPAQPAEPLTPVAAAALRSGSALKLDGITLTVRDLFQMPVAGKYGLLAQSGNEWAVVRWTADNIEFYCGPALAEKEVLASFKQQW